MVRLDWRTTVNTTNKDMKIVTLQIKMNVPNNYPLNNSDDIQQLLLDFPNKTVFIDGKVV